jgi:hypothetical protein
VVNVTGDYSIEYGFTSNYTSESFLAVMMNETTNLPIISALSMCPAWGAQTDYGTQLFDYNWRDAGSAAYIGKIVNLTNGDVFSLGVEPDTATLAIMTDGSLEFGVDDRPLTYCSIKRLF